MAIRALVSRTRLLLSRPATRLSSTPWNPNPISSCSSSSQSEDVNEICRVLSDFRHPHHDLESALSALSAKVSPAVVEQVLKRCKGLGVSSHRFFLWVGKLPGFSRSRESYHVLVDILGRCRQFPLIWDLLLELRDGGGEYQIGKDVFWLMFRSYCRARLPGDAIRAFGKMGDFGLKPDVNDFYQLLLNLCGNELMVDAVIFVEKMRTEFEMNPKIYSMVMKGWVDSGNPAEAVKLFDEMLSSCHPDVVAYNTYMGALCKMGEFAQAYKLLKEMKARGCEPNSLTYSVLLRAHCQADDADSADRVLHQMGRYNLVPNVFTYNCMIKLLCRSGKVDKAYELLDEMMEKGSKPDIWSYNTVLVVHCKLKEVNKALRLLNRMYKEGSCAPDLHTYNMLLKMLIDVGRFDRAVAIWDGMEEKGFHPSSSTYAVMIHGFCKKKGKIEEACKYFEIMVDDGIPPYLNTCETLRDCLLRVGLRENLHVIRNKMQQSTSCTIQELSGVMVDKRRRRREVHTEEQNELCNLMD